VKKEIEKRSSVAVVRGMIRFDDDKAGYESEDEIKIK
jgi:hypothetical protein